MEITSIMEVWKYFRWLPNFILKRIFSKERLSGLVYIDVKPRGESVRVTLGETSSFDIWFQIINMTPFVIELDRAEFEIRFSGIQVKNKHLRKSTIKSGEIYGLYISDNLDGDQAKAINRMAQSGNRSSINLYAVFNSSLHQFEKQQTQLDEVNVKYIGLKSDNNA